ncbi:hypothetical protein BDW62DRAFT_187292 [Aspergillus aurantiobrunneus]
MTHFSDYYFTSNLTRYTCPEFGSFQCEPPNACAREPSTGKMYCCDYNDNLGDVCWSIQSDCADDGSTLSCGSGDDPWCCLYDSEKCTSVSDQRNICWNNELSPLGNISADVLQDTYSSLTSAEPSARTWAFDPASLMPVSATPSATDTPGVDTTPTPDSEVVSNSGSDSLSGGTIAGIVVGAVVGVALILGAAWFLLRRRRRGQGFATATVRPEGAPAELGDERLKERFEVDGSPLNKPKPAQELPEHNQ